MSTEPTAQEGLNWSPPEPTPVVSSADAGHDRPAGSAAPSDPPRVEQPAAAGADASPLDGVIAKLPPAVQEKPEALVGVAFGAGIGAAVVLRVLGGILR